MLTAQVGLGGRIEDRKFPQLATGTMWKNMATYAPNLYPVRTPEGYFTGSAKFPNNPLGSLLGLGWNSRHAYDVQATARLTHKLDFITPGLSAYASIALNSSYQNGYGKTRDYAYYEPIYTKNDSGADEVYFENRSNDTDLKVTTGSDSETSRMYLQAGFEYDRHFGRDHHLSGLLMYQQNTRSVLGQQAIYAQQLIAGRINYAYRQKYLLEAVVSYNGSENYAKGNRFGVFPAGSVGWVISNENFLKDNRTLNYLKLRASAGLVGNNRGASRFAYEQYWGIGANKGCEVLRRVRPARTVEREPDVGEVDDLQRRARNALVRQPAGVRHRRIPRKPPGYPGRQPQLDPLFLGHQFLDAG